MAVVVIDKTEREIALGARAQELLNNEVLKALLEAAKRDVREAWERSEGVRTDDVLARESLRLELRAINKIWAKLESLAANGKYAQRMLQT